MIWVSIGAMALLVFASRYLFLAPGLPIKLSAETQKLLSYSSPAVLTAILAPIVFLPEGEVALSWTNPYLVAAITAVLLAWKLKNVLLTTVLSMALFFLLSAW
ncbi:AzlD domain-containing protein [Photobacterium atrarenae]|uniref:AzlD domain-containing protein n=1 Tax=Photobacterium atrarenae TaxID=865757 RepID=A0ABY5GNT2_9GAMM|nr:AzlD domain-containing protein [Photobacterium atrarenae]UTV30339.1 AzlD domain-containing protein [Photobacterium atrarenae]